MIGTNTNQFQRYTWRGTCVALLSVLTILLFAVTASAQNPAVPIVVSQQSWLPAFSAGGVLSAGDADGTSWGVNSKGVIVASETYGNNIIQFSGPGYAESVIGTVTNNGTNGYNQFTGVAIDSNDNLYVAFNNSPLIVKIPPGTSSAGTYTPSANGTYPSTFIDPNDLPTGVTLPTCVGVLKTDQDAGECVIQEINNTIGYSGISALAFDAANNLYFVTNDTGYNATSNPGVAFSIYECTATHCLKGTLAPVQLFQENVSANPSNTGTLYIGGITIDPWNNIFFTDSLEVTPSDNSYNVNSFLSNLNELPATTATGTGFGGVTTGWVATQTVLETLNVYSPPLNTGNDNDDEIAAVFADQTNGTIYFGTANSGLYALSGAGSAGATAPTSSLYAISNQGTKLIMKDAYGNLIMVGNTSGADTLGYLSLSGPTVPGTETVGTPLTSTFLVADNTAACPASGLSVSLPASTVFTATQTTGTCGSSSLNLPGLSAGAAIYSYTLALNPSATIPPSSGLTVADSTSLASTTVLAKGSSITGVSQFTWGQDFISGGSWGSNNEAGTSAAINTAGTVVIGDGYASTNAGPQEFIGGIDNAPILAGPDSGIAAVAIDANNNLFANVYNQPYIIKVPMTTTGTYTVTVDPGATSFTTTSIPYCQGGAADTSECLLPVSDPTLAPVAIAGMGAMIFDAQGDLFFATNQNGTSSGGTLAQNEAIYECALSNCLYNSSNPTLTLIYQEPAANALGEEYIGQIALDTNGNLFYTDSFVAASGGNDEFNLSSDLQELPVDTTAGSGFGGATTGFAAAPTTLETWTDDGTPACTAAPCDYNNNIPTFLLDASNNIYFADQYTGIYELTYSGGSYTNLATPTAVAAPGAKILLPDGTNTFYHVSYNNTESSDALGLTTLGSVTVPGYGAQGAPSTTAAPTTGIGTSAGAAGSPAQGVYVLDNFGCNTSPVLSFSFADTTDTWTGTQAATGATDATGDLAFGGGCSIYVTITFAPAAGTTGTVSTTMTVTDTTNGGTISDIPVSATAAAAQIITFTNPTASETIPYSTTPIVLAATGGTSGNAVTFAVTSGPGSLAADGVTLTITGVGTIVITATQNGGTVGGVTYAAGTNSINITVTQATPVITCPGVPSTVAYPTTISLSSCVSTDPNAVLTYTNVSGATLNNTTLTPSGVGTVSVTVGQSSDTDYTSATLPVSVTVTPGAQVATPVITPASGTVLSTGTGGSDTVTISGPSGATIYYTTDGQTPGVGNADTTQYSAPITLSTAGSVTVEAIAVETGYASSSAASATYTVVTTAPAFTVTGGNQPSSPITITSSTPGSVTLTITPSSGFDQQISFSCADSTGITLTCSFSPSTLTPTGTDAPLTTTVTITEGSGNASLQKRTNPFLPGGVTFALALGLFGWKKRRGLLLALLLVMGAITVGQITGCGGSSSGTTGTVTVNATGGGTTMPTVVNVVQK